MIRKLAIILFLSLLIVCAPGAPATVTAADFQSRLVTPEVAVLQPEVQARDVTDLYATGADRGSRYDAEHRFLCATGTDSDQATRGVILTSDGGAVVAGLHYNDDNDSEDCLIIKYDDKGSVIWARTLGGAGIEYFKGVGETPDGAYVAAGYSNSYGSGELQLLLVKFNSNGGVIWTRTAGGGTIDGADGADAMCIKADGTIAIAGLTSNYGAVDTDALMMGFDGTGTLLWCTMAGAPLNDRLFSLRPTSDGGYIGTGWTVATGASQTLLIKFDAAGAVSWCSVVGDVGFNVGYAAEETPDGGYLLTGITSAYDPYGTYDVMLARFGADGTLYWARSLGLGNVKEVGHALTVRDDGGFTIAGTTFVDSGSSGNATLLCFDGNGGLQWARQIGTGEGGYFRDLLDLPGGGYLAAGGTESFGSGGNDVLFASLDENGLVPGCQYTQTWDITSPLRTPAWSFVTLTEASPTPTVNSLTISTTDPGVTVEPICDYQKLDPEYWLVASGRDDPDWADAIGQTPDQGYLVATQSWVSIYNTDVLLLKYDSLGDLEWAREAGGEFDEIPRDLLVTDDGGCIVVGYTSTYGAGLDDALMMRFDSGGALLWTSVTGGTQFDRLSSIHQKSDGNYLAVGNTDSYGEGLFDLLAVELTSAGTVPSVRTLGTAQNEVGLRGIALSGGGSVIAGYSNPDGGDQDAIAVRMEDDGSFTWCSESGSAGVDRFYGIVELPGGDLLLGGYTNSYGDTDILLVKLAGNGARQWFRTAETSNYESLYDLKPTGDGDVVGCGRISQVRGATNDALLCRFDSEGQALWAHRIGSDGEDNFEALVVHEDGFAAAGSTTSFGSSSVQAFVAHTDRDGMVRNCYLFSSETLITSDQYPPGGGYTMTSAAISPPAENPFVENWGMEPSHLELCRALPPTVSAYITSLPSVGTVPFSTLMSVSLANNYSEQTRRMAAHIDVVLANKAYFPNWRAGYTNLAPGENYTTSWMQDIPALATVIGENRFHLFAEDVTPSPYNQPPYPPAGDTDTSLQVVTAYAP